MEKTPAKVYSTRGLRQRARHSGARLIMFEGGPHNRPGKYCLVRNGKLTPQQASSVRRHLCPLGCCDDPIHDIFTTQTDITEEPHAAAHA